MTNQFANIDQPASPITPQTTLLCIDVESNGLHGPAFAVGSVLMRLDGTLLDEYSARCPIRRTVDPWVKDNVLPPMAGFPQTHSSAKAMRADFWVWYKQAKSQADYVMADNGYPVEARFLIQCQEDNIDDRYWDHPFPLLDLSSMLMQVGVKPQAVRYRFVAQELGSTLMLQHNPRFDAWVSALATIKALRLSGRLT